MHLDQMSVPPQCEGTGTVCPLLTSSHHREPRLPTVETHFDFPLSAVMLCYLSTISVWDNTAISADSAPIYRHADSYSD